ncbi:MAG: hypothetical protein LUQ25_00370 [Methanoregulaceae archaeon]|nr:hypothetical protein [Methanoregulaceae archaeon]
MKRFLPAVIILLLCALLAGCTSVPPANNPPEPRENIIMGTVDTLPAGSNVVFQVGQKDAIHNTIDVTFAGGEGQNQVQNIEVIYTGDDGASQTQFLKAEKGATATFQGTGQTDQILVYVTMNNGNRYKVVNQTSPYRTRG